MADPGKVNARERFTKREREIIKELAREIVREARLARDFEATAAQKRVEEIMDARIRHAQSEIDFYKHMTTLSGASIVGVIAVSGAYLQGALNLVPVYTSLGILQRYS